LEQSKRNTLIVIGLGILLVITIIISFRLGRYPIPAKEVLGILLSKIYPIELFWTDQVEMVLINIRLPRFFR
jgi:iron complex transport system permease protein